MHRCFFPTGLSQMHFVPHPFGVPLAALTGIGLIGRTHPLGIGHQRAVSPAHQAVDLLEMLVPHLLQEHQTGAIPHTLARLLIGWCLRAYASYLLPPACARCLVPPGLWESAVTQSDAHSDQTRPD